MLLVYRNLSYIKLTWKVQTSHTSQRMLIFIGDSTSTLTKRDSWWLGLSVVCPLFGNKNYWYHCDTHLSTCVWSQTYMLLHIYLMRRLWFQARFWGVGTMCEPFYLMMQVLLIHGHDQLLTPGIQWHLTHLEGIFVRIDLYASKDFLEKSLFRRKLISLLLKFNLYLYLLSIWRLYISP